jgi:hypothetical protein
MNRRYKVFLSDLEKALIYALSHEVAQHATIAGQPQQHVLPFALSFTLESSVVDPARIRNKSFRIHNPAWISYIPSPVLFLSTLTYALVH